MRRCLFALLALFVLSACIPRADGPVVFEDAVGFPESALGRYAACPEDMTMAQCASLLAAVDLPPGPDQLTVERAPGGVRAWFTGSRESVGGVCVSSETRPGSGIYVWFFDEMCTEKTEEGLRCRPSNSFFVIRVLDGALEVFEIYDPDRDMEAQRAGEVADLLRDLAPALVAGTRPIARFVRVNQR